MKTSPCAGRLLAAAALAAAAVFCAAGASYALDYNSPTVSIVNPLPGTVSAPSLISNSPTSGGFRVQVQTWNDVADITSVKVGYCQGADPDICSWTWVGASVNNNYACGTGCSIYNATLSLAPGYYWLMANAVSTGEGVGTSKDKKTKVETNADPRYIYVNVLALKNGTGMLLRRDDASQLCIDCHGSGHGHSSQSTDAGYGNWGTVCDDCHTPHGTTNLYLIKEKILTPTSGFKNVVFQNTTVFNTPGGYVDGGAGPLTEGICQVCHTQLPRWTNTSPGDGHGQDSGCTGCHSHSGGFAGGESKGGVACDSCHKTVWPQMSGTSKYHHYMANSAASYPAPAQPANMGTGSDPNRGCTMCHVDHDIFRPDINIGNNTRAGNLRASISCTPASDLSATFSNTDFINDATYQGGICMSCHVTSQTNVGYAQPDGSTARPAIPFANTVSAQLAAYNASAHNYLANSTISSDSSAFRANCTKCHNDDMSPKSGYNAQSSASKFGLHQSGMRSSLSNTFASVGFSNSTDRLEERFCFVCHRRTADSVAGMGAKPYSGKDVYNSASMASASEFIYNSVTNKTYRHGVSNSTWAGRHKPTETLSGISSNQHVECEDCHNPHSAKAGVHSAGSSAFAGVLNGATGAITNFPSTNWNANATYALGSASGEYQICFKCHSSANTNYASWGGTGSLSWTNLALEFSPANKSRHPVGESLAVSNRLAANQLAGGWTPGAVMTCSDCHANDDSAASKGPHGSSVRWMLAGTNRAWPYTTTAGNGGSTGTYWTISTANSGTAPNKLFCLNCHPVPSASISAAHETFHTISCVDCHIRVSHGGKVTRFINADNTGTALPSRYFPNGQGGGRTASYVRQFTKAATPSGYGEGNCYIFGTACYGGHNSSATESW